MTTLGEMSLDANLTDNTRYNLEQSLDSNCKLEFASSAQQFTAAFHDYEQDEEQCLLQETNQSKIYCLKAKFGNGFVIGKVYKCKSLRDVIREFLIVRTLKLMPYYDLFHLHNRIVLVMKLLPQSLPQYVRSHRVNESQCKRIIAQILHKLCKLHKIGYLHCDIKPSNIMKDEHDEWFLIDFGYIFHESHAKHKDIDTRYFGSIGWTPPELRPYTDEEHRNAYCMPATDIWPIGLLILWLLLDGEQPYMLSQQEMQKYPHFQQRLEYFYYSKLLRQADEQRGQEWLAAYLKSLRDEHRISAQLFDLLSNEILLFDASKRSDCCRLWKHAWFDSIRSSHCIEHDDDDDDEKADTQQPRNEEEDEDESQDEFMQQADEEESDSDGANANEALEHGHSNNADWLHWFAESIGSCKHFFEH